MRIVHSFNGSILHGGDQSSIGRLMAVLFDDRPRPLSNGEVNVFTREVLRYVFQLSGWYDIKARLKSFKLSGPRLKMLSRYLQSSYEFNLAIRQVILHCISNHVDDQRVVMEKFKRASLPIQDAQLLHNLGRIGLRDEIESKCESAERTPISSPMKVMRECQEFLDRHDRYFKSLTFKKLRFIADGNNLGMDDLASDLREKAVKVYYHCSPYMSRLHTENSVRQSVTNYSGTIIKFYTTEKRRRMYRIEGTGEFANTIQTMEPVSSSGHSYQDDHDNSSERSSLHMEGILNMGGMNDDVDELMMRMSIDKYVDLGPPNRRRIVDLLLLRDDQEFIKWTKSKSRMRSVDDVHDLFLKTGQEAFITLVSECLNVPRLTVNRIAMEIRSMV